eukprot:m.58338 g.58338  ORF g.58338 m.58338 type:complete len:76 (+) comp13140_c0_seq1:928-1155(+)
MRLGNSSAPVNGLDSYEDIMVMIARRGGADAMDTVIGELSFVLKKKKKKQKEIEIEDKSTRNRWRCNGDQQTIRQ